MDFWKLIYKRDASSDNFDELVTLAHNENVNFRNENCFNDTPLHQAIRKNDKKCVEFLMTLNPDLTKTNDHKETPVDLAKKLNHNEILNLLQPAMEVKKAAREGPKIKINSDFLKTWIIADSSECFQPEPQSKVLKIEIKNSAVKPLDHLESKDFQESFKNSPHMFVVIVEDDSNQSVEDFSKFFIVSRPVIVQWKQTGKTPEIYFKNDKSKEFLKFERGEVDSKTFSMKFKSKSHCNFPTLLNGLASKMCYFDGNLLNLCVDTVSLISCAQSAIKFSLLCFCFLQLFLRKSLNFLKDVPIENSLEYEGVEMLLAAIQLPYGTSNLMNHDRLQLHSKDCCNDNLLVISAVENNNVEALEFLLLQDVDVGQSIRYANIAWKSKNVRCLRVLLANDSPFPDKFNINQVNDEEIRTIFNARQTFFNHIKAGAVKIIEETIKKNSKLEIVYNEDNISALRFALEMEMHEVYTLLMSMGFTSGIDKEELEKTRTKLVGYQNLKLRANANKVFLSVDDYYILHLIVKSKLKSNEQNRQSAFKAIRNFYEKINEVDGGKLILQFMGEVDKLQVVFDFDQSHIKELDHTASDRVVGRTYSHTGMVYIAGSREEKASSTDDKAETDSTTDNKASTDGEIKVMGTIAHELSHYIMELVYENESLPYAKEIEAVEGRKAPSPKERFSEIVNKIREYSIESKNNAEKKLDPILERVFSYQSSNPDDDINLNWHKEMIVRVIQLQVHSFLSLTYKQILDEQKQIRCVADLFKFYEEVTARDIETKLKTIKSKLMTEEINKLDGTARKFVESKLRIRDEQIDNLVINSPIPNLFQSNIPELTLINVYQQLNRMTPKAVGIFVTYDSIMKKEFLTKIALARERNNNRYLVVDCSNEPSGLKISREIQNILRSLDKTIFVSGNPFAYEQISAKTITHSFADLTETSKKIVLSKEVEFQGLQMEFKSFIDEELALEVDLKHLLTESVEVGRKLKKPVNHIEREFVWEDQSGKFKNTKNLIKNAEEKKVVIICDAAGAGKSMEIRHIAYLFKQQAKHKWIQLIDLKKHVDCIGKFNDSPNFLNFLNNLMKDENYGFDEIIFNNFYRKGKTILLLDGIDKIPSCLKDLVLEQLGTFNSNLGNILVITARSYLKEEFERVFSQGTYRLNPFSGEDKIAYLVSYNEISRDTARSMVEKFSTLNTASDDMTSVPFFLRAIAETYKEDKKSFDSMDLFTFFNNCYVERMIKFGVPFNEISGFGIRKLMEELTATMKAHESIALNQFFGTAPLSEEEMWKHGLITINKGKPWFSHQTVAQFFLASFLARDGTSKLDQKAQGSFLKEKEFEVARLFLGLTPSGFQILETLLNDFLKSLEDETQKLDYLIYAMGEKNELHLKAAFKTTSDGNSFFEKFASTTIELEKFSDEFLEAHKDKKENILHFVARCQQGDVVSAILQNLKDKMSNEKLQQLFSQENKRSLNPLHVLLMTNTTQQCIEYFLNFMENVLEENKLQSFLDKPRTGNRMNPFMIVSKYNQPECIEQFWDFVQRKIDPNNQKEIVKYMGIKRKSRNGVHSLQHAAWSNTSEAFKTVANIIQNTLERAELQEMLKYTEGGNSYNRNNLLHYASKNKTCSRVAAAVIEVLTEILGAEEVRKMMIRKNNRGLNSLQNLLVYNKNQECVENFLTSIQSLFKSSPDELKLLTSLDRNQSNILHLIVRNQNENVLKKCSDVFDEFFRSNYGLFLISNERGENIFQAAVKYGSREVATGLFEFARDKMSEVDWKKEVFHKAINRESKEFVEILVDFFQPPRFSDLELIDSMKAIEKGRNVFHYAACNNNFGVAALVFQLGNKFMIKTRKFSMLKEAEKELSRNIFHFLFKSATRENIDEFFRLVRFWLTDLQVKELCLALSKDKKEAEQPNQNIVQIAVQRRGTAVSEKLFSILESDLNFKQNEKEKLTKFLIVDGKIDTKYEESLTRDNKRLVCKYHSIEVDDQKPSDN
jgi:hypothetical protein